MTNLLIDAPPSTPDAPEPLRPACLMSLDELATTHANYERRLHHDLVWGEDSFTEEELAHAYEVGVTYADWQDAVKWTYQRPD